jgi:2,3-bisphosphoglycerate-independent phosphoglycerate mutase
MKGVLLIVDGLGDLPVEALGGATPLEAATTPVLDCLAANGRYGLIDPIGAGETPNTHSGAGALLGLEPGQGAQFRRGPVEAAGLGLDLQPGDIALRANFATLRPEAEGFTVVDRRAGRISEGTGELAAALERIDYGEGVNVTFQPTEQHRAVMLLSGPGLDMNVTDTDPGDRKMPSRLPDCRAVQPGAERTALLLNRLTRLAYRQLRDHPVNRSRLAAGLLPANGIIARGAGTSLELKNIVHHFGLEASVVSGCNTVKGLGRLFGFDVVSDARFTGSLDTDLEAKIAAVISQLDDHDLVYLHIKAPDICAHDKQPLAKRDFLQRMDSALAPLQNLDLDIAVAADHTTDSNSGFHTSDPVPAIISRSCGQPGAVALNFGETACRSGNLQRQTAHKLVLEFIGNSRKLEAAV